MRMGLWHEHFWSRRLEEDQHKPNIPLLAWTGKQTLDHYIQITKFFNAYLFLFFHLQNLKSDLSLWQLGTLPPGLIAFHGHVHIIDPFWHMLGLGYQDNTSIADAETAGVVHFNGRAKPWLDIAFPQLRQLWSKYVDYSDKFIKSCHIRAS